MSDGKESLPWIAVAFFMANLLFVGVFYIALWILYFSRYQHASAMSQNHIKQALVASTISSLIFAAINIFILLSGGYDNVTALIALELYFMILVPVFFLVGVFALMKAVANLNYHYPIIARMIDLRQVP